MVEYSAFLHFFANLLSKCHTPHGLANWQPSIYLVRNPSTGVALLVTSISLHAMHNLVAVFGKLLFADYNIACQCCRLSKGHVNRVNHRVVNTTDTSRRIGHIQSQNLTQQNWHTVFHNYDSYIRDNQMLFVPYNSLFTRYRRGIAMIMLNIQWPLSHRMQ